MNYSELFVKFSRLNRFDKIVKTKKYNVSIFLLCKYINEEIIGKIDFFTIDNSSIVYKDIFCFPMDVNCFQTSSLESFHSDLNNWINTMLRSFVNQCVHSCNISSDELIEVTRDIEIQLEMENCVFSRNAERMYKFMSKKSDAPIVLIGDSSSGKTVASAQVVKRYIYTNGASYSWIDFSDVNTDVEQVVFTILRRAVNSEHILILDNVQSYPSKLLWIKQIVEFFRTYVLDIRIRLLIISWNSAKRVISDVFSYLCPIYIYSQGDEIITDLIRKNKLERYEEEILVNSAGDVFVANSSIIYIRENKSFPTVNQLSEMIYKLATKNYVLSEDGRRVLFYVSALGEFEIHVRKKYLEKISSKGLDELIDKNILRIYKTENQEFYITIGHRSLAHKITAFLMINSSFSFYNPIDLALDYLSEEKDDQILSALERLDLELELDDTIFARLWQAFCHMRSALMVQVESDSTWGNNMASMIFAIEALVDMPYMISNSDILERCKNDIRKRWTIENNALLFVGNNNNIEITTELVDFVDSIKKTMEEEEKAIEYKSDMLSSNIDYYKFHDNWLLGLLLGFEANFQKEGYLQKYLDFAKSIQLPSGAFYPERVCWVTARIIMGLAQCGYSYSDDIVKRASNWLVNQLRPREKVGWNTPELSCSGWISGTGSWNSNEQITMMCICALYSVKYPIRKNQETALIVSEFWKYREKLAKLFIDKGSILDIIWIIDMMIYDERNPIELKEEIRELSGYLIDNWGSASKLSSEKETESSDVSFMAKELISIIWVLLRKNLKELLKGLELNYKEKDKKKKIFISYRRVEGGGSALAQSVYKGLNEVYKDEVFLDVYDLDSVSSEYNPVLHKAVIDADIFIVILSDHCFDRACKEEYINDKDLFYSEIKTAFDNNKEIISVYELSNHNKCPDELKVNRDFYDIAYRLSKRNAAYYNSKIPNAVGELVDNIVKKIRHFGI